MLSGAGIDGRPAGWAEEVLFTPLAHRYRSSTTISFYEWQKRTMAANGTIRPCSRPASSECWKDRSPPWIKLHRTWLDNAEFHRLPVASRALAPMLWLLAAEYRGGEITASNEDIAWRFRMSADDFEAALNPLVERGFFSSSVALADRKRDAMPETERETEEETKTEEETDSRSIVDRPTRAPSRFDEFWKAYPHRDGPNPRKPAEAKFNALVKRRLDLGMLIDEVNKFAVAEKSRGNIGTRLIPQATRWLNEQRWADHAAIAALHAINGAPEISIEEAVKSFARFGHWSRNAGAEPGLTGCRAAPELLANYGLGPDGRKIPRPEPFDSSQRLGERA
jgi:hypothetical protein